MSDESTYPDPWGPGGKFIESGLYQVEGPNESDPEEDDAEPEDA